MSAMSKKVGDTVRVWWPLQPQRIGVIVNKRGWGRYIVQLDDGTLVIPTHIRKLSKRKLDNWQKDLESTP
jgi:hypothetical protein